MAKAVGARSNRNARTGIQSSFAQGSGRTHQNVLGAMQRMICSDRRLWTIATTDPKGAVSYGYY